MRLIGADLEGASLWKTNLSRADLTEANLRGANLRQAQMVDAVAVRTNISRSVCWKADFRRANLHMADFWGSDLSDCIMHSALLTEARLHGTVLVRADLTSANISKAMVYGSATWDAILDGTTQRDLVITPDAARQKWHGYSRMELQGPLMTVDDLEIAQLIRVLLNHRKLRNLFTTLGEKAVLATFCSTPSDFFTFATQPTKPKISSSLSTFLW